MPCHGVCVEAIIRTSVIQPSTIMSLLLYGAQNAWPGAFPLREVPDLAFGSRWQITAGDKKTAQINLRRSLSYYLTAHCGGLSIYLRFSQSFTGIGLLATVSDRRRSDVSALPLGSKCSTIFCERSPGMHVIIAESDPNGSTPEYLLVFVLAVLKWPFGLRLDSCRVASILGHSDRGVDAGCICGLYAVLN
jgi:hypothetical protein